MDLSHKIRMTFGTNPNEPNKSQLTMIAMEVKRAYDSGRIKSLRDYSEIVKKHCPSAGTWGYKGLDNSDLNTLIALAIKETQKG